ncbi:MAG: hypothetical protein FJ206_06240 [Gemmatimonadetes bacterium]|nr:hypothetical protein [Gemmatimonadota bacterium]
MKGFLGTVGILAALATGAAAQAPGLPVVNGGVTRGAMFGVMAGVGNDGAGSGTAVGIQGGYGFRRLAIAGFASTLSGSTLDDGTFFSGGAAIAYRVLGGPLVPVSLNFHAGAAYSEPALALAGGGASTFKSWHVPIGLGLSWTFPQPVVAVKPWLSPRADIRRTSTPFASVGTDTETDFGLSGGITFGFLNGLGIDLAFDRVFAGGTGSKPTVVGLGLSYSLK